MIPDPLEWEPREVLALGRWGDYQVKDKGVIKRIFFCAFVLLAASEGKESIKKLHGQISNMIIAIDCASLLGEAELSMLLAFLGILFRLFAQKIGTRITSIFIFVFMY